MVREQRASRPADRRASRARSIGRACLFASALVIALAHTAAAAPALINYQGRLLDDAGAPLDGTFALTFRILPTLTGGTPLFVETHPSVLAIDGVFQVVLGSVAALDPSVFDLDDLWLEVVVEGETLEPRQRITSEAFAFRAQGAETLLQSCSEGDILRYLSGVWTCTPVSALLGTCTPGQVEACYSGPPGTQGIGVCSAGTRTCTGGSVWGTCTGELLPALEVCNGLDDDCDGAIDDGNPGGGGSCSTGQPGICAAGTQSCLSGALICSANSSPTAEVCNGLDDDCDGAIDDGNPGGGGSCSTGQPGICAAGTQSCLSGALICSANSFPSPEVCNGLDDDCDGLVDEGGVCP